MSYIGRFAPSPSGELHFGSLVTALGSYLQARSQNGKWLVRIEDVDLTRKKADAANKILTALDAYQLHWDDSVIYQSARMYIYQEYVDMWLADHCAYYCSCTRAQIKQQGGIYLGNCRHKQLTSGTVRLAIDNAVTSFIDKRLGLVKIATDIASEDFIIKRSDGLFAYNLAVVLDDIYQGITEIVRGEDLLETTGRQISLYNLLKQPLVSYIHLPLVKDAHGKKLSKQNHAPAIDITNPRPTLLHALSFLGFDIPTDVASADISHILNWACQMWEITQLQTCKQKLVF